MRQISHGSLYPLKLYMGKILEELLSDAKEHLDNGMLRDMSVSRLKLLIGEQILAEIQNIKDDKKLVEILERSIKSLFESSAEDRPHSHTDPDAPQLNKGQPSSAPLTQSPDGSASDSAKPGYQLKITSKGAQTELYGVPIMFASSFIEESLYNLVAEENPQSLTSIRHELQQVAAKNIGKLMANAVAHGMEHDPDMIKFGLTLFRALGFGRVKVSGLDADSGASQNEYQLQITQGLTHTSWGSYVILGYLESLYKFVYHGKVQIDVNDDMPGVKNSGQALWLNIKTG